MEIGRRTVLKGLAATGALAAAGPWVRVASAQAPDAILVGATLALTGPFSDEVAPFKKFMELWAEQINAQGGIMLREYGKRVPVKFIVYDDTSKPPVSLTSYEKLVTVDKVHLLLGPYSSPITTAASTVADKHKIPFIALEANSTSIFNRGFQWLVGVIDDGPKWSWHYFDMLKAEGKAKTIGFIVQETGHTKEVGAGSAAKAQEIGLKVVVQETAPAPATEFTPVITKMKAADPDIVYISGFPAFNVAFYKQALEQGLSPREFHVIHHGSAFRKPTGDARANLVTGENYWMPGVKGGGDVALFEELLTKTGLSVADYPWVSIHMFGLETLKAALEKAGTVDREKVLKALWDLDIKTISGRLRFQKKGEGLHPDAQGQGTLNPFPTQIQEGKYITLWPQEIATGKHIYPRK